ncbi:MAG TPA: cob(I)yrinic acid a,c-diamide adenosyltransferase [Pusillimonas sp.]|uniref:cob(I)yrinic acid a,c-diamide adenosyltransferase n=1 Tax=Pusillimonas sp. TaxID=3040095 RepID=UPI002B4ADB8E|nr:cob(I)yrinic acid a,c-diamide adenosyltransferase [Pusillimonas sp.]HLU19707.1 cob(I)yrinic acid a,c-diamide adenosyltransferase [Pusillimonas sp.]
MATRLTIITTRGGDSGDTGLGDGSRIRKDAPRVAAMGDVDELNSAVGLLRAESLPAEIDAILRRVQNDLFDVGAQLCIPGHTAVAEKQIVALEKALALYNAELGPLKEFILPGGTRSAALAHMARTICRRAERSVVSLLVDATGDLTKDQDRPDRLLVQYLNRLSDLLFVLARALNKAAGRSDVLWEREAH